jgi:hypothetical protein
LLRGEDLVQEVRMGNELFEPGHPGLIDVSSPSEVRNGLVWFGLIKITRKADHDEMVGVVLECSL